MIVKSCANLNITCSYPFYVKCLSLSSSCLVCLKMGHFLSFFRQFDSPSTYNCVLPLDFYFLCNKTTRQKLYIFFVFKNPENEFILLRIYILILHDVVNLNIFQIVRTPTHHTLLNTKKKHPRSEKFHIPLFALRNVAQHPQVTPLET